MSFEKEFEIMRRAEQAGVAFHHAMGVMFYDAETVAPEKSVEGRGRTLSFLGDIQYGMMTDPELMAAIETLKAHKDEFGPDEQREIELSDKEVSSVAKIPKDEYLAAIVLQDEATYYWKKAKEASDFSIFLPYLEKIVEYNRKLAGWLAPEKKPYDALLDLYEEGLDMEFCDKFFSDLREGLVPLIKKVSAAPQVSKACLEGTFPVDAQREFTKEICHMMGLDMDKVTLGEVEHPFTENFNNSDIRLTTHYYEHDFADNMFSILHEGGHSMYEMNCDDKYNFTVFQGGVSMGVHESQSRFYENIIGRSFAFTGPLLEAAKKYFPEQLKDVTHEDFWKAVNRAEAGPIRIAADELTYALHILVRYEIEKQMIAGTLAVKDAPAEWNRLYEEYLGVTPENDAKGILQDSHWAGTSIGYFPTYALGSAYGAQMLDRMLKDHPDLWDKVAKGDLSDVTEWLRTHIHQYACYYKPKDLFEKACGKFDTKYFVDYLTKKYTEVYGL
ncbi:MAG: carboxypeptidase M32 [Firmicutes bacterium]|nr:carboxypeptidase M32 [Bacillota bacterium]